MARPKTYARVAGCLYLAVIALGIFAQAVVRNQLVAAHDATATAHNILANQLLFRAGFVADVVALMCDVALAVLLYELLRPVNRTLALLAAIFELMGDAILGALSMGHFTAVMILGAHYLTGFSQDQLNTLALLALRVHNAGYNLALAPISLRDILIGYLIFRSALLPRVIGVLLIITGVNFLAGSLTDFLSLPYPLESVLLWPGVAGELSFCLWLIVMGVNEPKWRALAALDTAPAPPS
jgi:hypothetical protein